MIMENLCSLYDSVVNKNDRTLSQKMIESFKLEICQRDLNHRDNKGNHRDNKSTYTLTNTLQKQANEVWSVFDCPANFHEKCTYEKNIKKTSTIFAASREKRIYLYVHSIKVLCIIVI